MSTVSLLRRPRRGEGIAPKARPRPHRGSLVAAGRDKPVPYGSFGLRRNLANARTGRQEDPRFARLRHRRRDAAPGCPEHIGALGPSGRPEAGGSAAGLLVQAARRLQQDGAVVGEGPSTGSRGRVGGQPRPGRRARGAEARYQVAHRDGPQHPQHQGRCCPGAKRTHRLPGGHLPAGRRPRGEACQGPGLHPRASVRRSGCHRRPRYGRHGDHEPASGAGRRLRSGGRRGTHRRHRRLRQVPAPRDPDRWRRGRGLRLPGGGPRGGPPRTVAARYAGCLRRRRIRRADRIGTVQDREEITSTRS